MRIISILFIIASVQQCFAQSCNTTFVYQRPPEFGQVHISDDGGHCKYSCDAGYKIIENYDKDLPLCIPKIKDGTINYFAKPGMVIFSCEQGLHLVGSNKWFLLVNGWSGSMPRCVNGTSEEENYSVFWKILGEHTKL